MGTKWPRLAVLCTGATLLLAAAARANWNQPAAGPLNAFPNGTATSGHPSSEGITSIGGTPYVTFDGNTAGTLYVSKLSLSGWTLVGNPTASSGAYSVSDGAFDAPNPSITSLNGAPYVAYQEWNGSKINQIRVRMFNGTDWVDVGGTSLNHNVADEALSPVIANVAGTLYVTWYENVSGTNQIFVKSFNGSSWVDVGTQPLNINSTHGASNPVITSVGGVPYVAWEESDGSGGRLVYVERLSAGSWSMVGGGAVNASGTPSGHNISVADIGGTPWAEWSEDTATGIAIYVKRLNGTSWSQVGGVANPDSTNDAFATIGGVGGRPYLGMRQSNGTVSDAFVRRFDGASWVNVGGSLKLNPGDNSRSTKLTDLGGVPYVTWKEGPSSVDCTFNNSAGCNVYVKRLEPDLGLQSATPSNTGAKLSVQVNNDYGVPLPIGFDYGATSALGSATPLTFSSGGGTNVVTQQITGLKPSTMYFFRAFSTDGARRIAQEGISSFMTTTTPVAINKLKRGKKHTVVITLTTPGSGTLAAVATFKSKGKHTFGKRTGTATGARQMTLTLKPLKAGLKALKKHHKLKLTVTITFTPTGGTPSMSTGTLKLKL